MKQHRFAKLAILLLIVASAGCQTGEPLPTYEWQGLDAALDRMRQRYAKIDTLTGRGTLTLQNTTGDRISLDTVLIAAPPDRLRAQAWKFDRKVLDFTADGETAWLWMEETEDDARPTPGDRQGPALFIHALRLPDRKIMRRVERRNAEDELTLAWPSERFERGDLHLAIHRPTLTVRRVWVNGPGGEPAGGATQDVELSDYRLFDGIPLPTRLRVNGPASMQVDLQEVELNAALPSGAFQPPDRAEPLY